MTGHMKIEPMEMEQGQKITQSSTSSNQRCTRQHKRRVGCGVCAVLTIAVAITIIVFAVNLAQLASEAKRTKVRAKSVEMGNFCQDTWQVQLDFQLDTALHWDVSLADTTIHILEFAGGPEIASVAIPDITIGDKKQNLVWDVPIAVSRDNIANAMQKGLLNQSTVITVTATIRLDWLKFNVDVDEQLYPVKEEEEEDPVPAVSTCGDTSVPMETTTGLSLIELAWALVPTAMPTAFLGSPLLVPLTLEADLPLLAFRVLYDGEAIAEVIGVNSGAVSVDFVPVMDYEVDQREIPAAILIDNTTCAILGSFDPLTDTGSGSGSGSGPFGARANLEVMALSQNLTVTLSGGKHAAGALALLTNALLRLSVDAALLESEWGLEVLEEAEECFFNTLLADALNVNEVVQYAQGSYELSYSDLVAALTTFLSGAPGEACELLDDTKIASCTAETVFGEAACNDGTSLASCVYCPLLPALGNANGTDGELSLCTASEPSCTTGVTSALSAIGIESPFGVTATFTAGACPVLELDAAGVTCAAAAEPGQQINSTVLTECLFTHYDDQAGCELNPNCHWCNNYPSELFFFGLEPSEGCLPQVDCLLSLEGGEASYRFSSEAACPAPPRAVCGSFDLSKVGVCSAETPSGAAECNDGAFGADCLLCPLLPGVSVTVPGLDFCGASGITCDTGVTTLLSTLGLDSPFQLRGEFNLGGCMGLRVDEAGVTCEDPFQDEAVVSECLIQAHSNQTACEASPDCKWCDGSYPQELQLFGLNSTSGCVPRANCELELDEGPMPYVFTDAETC